MNKVKERKLQRSANRGIRDFNLISSDCNSLELSSSSPGHTIIDHVTDTRPNSSSNVSTTTTNNGTIVSKCVSEISVISASANKIIASHQTPDLLRSWALKHKITSVALGELLSILNNHPYFDLPKDPRTFLSTPRSTTVIKVEPGEYVHFDWISSVKKIISESPAPPNCVSLQINIDGIPLYRNSPVQFWPILGKIVDKSISHQSSVFVIGIYCGEGKPRDINEFIQTFIHEYISLGEYSELKSKISTIVCDLPARASLLGIKGHSGFCSCGKCDIKGEYYFNRVVFPFGVHNPRTDESFRAKLDKGHHNNDSLIELLPIDLVKDVPGDFMHLVCLGVTRKLLFLWSKGKKCPARLRPHQIEDLSRLLISIKKYIPQEFARTPRSIRDLDHWKATEFRQFILYSGPVLLKRILSQELYQHFLCLHVAIVLLVNSKTYKTHNNYANQLLSYFVEHYAKLYGKENLSHNVHSLLHLAQDSLRHGPLDQFSAFPFENKLQEIKKLVRGPSLPLQQVHRRLVEREKLEVGKKPSAIYPKFSKPIDSESRSQSYKVCEFADFILKTTIGNNACRLRDGSVVLIKSFDERNGIQSITGHVFRKCDEFYSSPCSSKLLNVQCVSRPTSEQRFVIDQIENKCVLLPFNSAYVCYPLLHSAIQ